MALTNQHIKHIRSLGLKKYRQKYAQFVVEGEKSIQELLTSSYEVERLYIQSERVSDVILNSGSELVECSAKDMERISNLKSPPGALALVNIPESKVSQLHEGEWTLVADGINDPGNLGTIIRIADWFGIKQVICSIDTVELYNPKTLMATMGSFTRVEVSYADLSQVMIASTAPLYFALLDGTSVKELKDPTPGAIVIGSEANGIRHELLTFPHTAISIEGKGTAESLNAGVSAGIICYALNV